MGRHPEPGVSRVKDLARTTKTLAAALGMMQPKKRNG
jgi:hypothetical protein